MDQKPSTSQPSKTKDTRSNRRREGGEFGGLEINDAVVEKLMKDPVKRQLILNIVASENKKIDAYKKTLKEKLQVTPTSSPKRNFESPTALYRRRVLQRRKSEQSSDISENGSIEPAYIQSPVCVDKLLKGVIAFVEVKSGTLDRSEPVKACVRSLGGVVKETFTRDVTHVIFKDGPYSTCQKARLLNVHLVSVLWLEACKISCTRISEKKFPALGTFDHNASTICTKMQNEYQDVLQEEIEQIKEKGSPLDHIQTVADKRKSLIKPAKFTIDPVPSSSADDDDDDSDDDTYIDGQMVNRRKLFKEHIKIKKIASSTQNKLSITNNSPVDMDLTDIDQYDNTNKENNSDNIYEVRTPNNKSKIIKTPEHYSDEIYEKKTEPCSSRTSTSKLKVSESTPKGTKDFSKITTKNITKMLAASLGSSERFSSSDSPSSFGIKNNFESLNNSPKAAQTNLNTNSDESYESCNSVVFIVEAPREKQNTTCNENVTLRKKSISKDHFSNVEITDDESTEITNDNIQPPTVTISDSKEEIVVEKKKLTADKIHAESSENTSENFQSSPETEEESESFQSSQETISDSEVDIVVGKKKLTADKIHNESSENTSENFQSSPETISDGEVEIIVGKKKLTEDKIHAESSESTSENFETSPETISDDEVGKKKFTADKIHSELSETTSENVQSSPEIISDGEEEIVVGKKKLTAATIHAESSKTGSKNVQSSPEVISDSEEIVVGKKKLTAATIHAESSKTTGGNVQSSPETISDSEEEDILVNFEKNSVVKLYRLDHNIIDQNRNTQDNATNRSLVNENKKRNTLKNKRNTIGPSTSSSNSTVENRRQTRRSSLLNGDQKRVLGSDSTSDEGDKSENRKRLRKLYTPSNYLNLIPPANDEKERQEKRDAAKKINEGYSSNKKTEITRSMVKAAIESAKKMQKECDNKSDSESDTDDDTVLKIPKTQIRELNSNSDTVDGDEDKDGGSKKKTVTETTTRTQDKDDNNNKKGGHTVTKPTNNKRRTAKKRANKKKSSDETDDEQDSSQKLRKTRASTRLSKKPCSTQRRQSLRLQQGPSQSCYRRSTLEFTPISNKKRLKLKPLEKPTVGSTKLHRTDIYVFGRIVNILGRFDYERKVTERTTHLVAGQPRRTMNMLKAIVLGCWIVRKTWMYDSMERGRWVPEEDYELTDFCPAVQANRLQRQAFGASFCVDLFENYGPMYISQSSVPETSDLRFLIEHCKGKITYVPRSASIIIGEYVDCMGVYCVKEQWVLDCITLNQKLPFESYFYR